jgi:hypothetical protein
MIIMTVIWLIVWLINGTPDVASWGPWNSWGIGLFVCRHRPDRCARHRGPPPYRPRRVNGNENTIVSRRPAVRRPAAVAGSLRIAGAPGCT